MIAAEPLTSGSNLYVPLLFMLDSVLNPLCTKWSISTSKMSSPLLVCHTMYVLILCFYAVELYGMCGGVYFEVLHKHFGLENDDLKYIKADHPLCLGLWHRKRIIMLLTV